MNICEDDKALLSDICIKSLSHVLYLNISALSPTPRARYNELTNNCF